MLGRVGVLISRAKSIICLDRHGGGSAHAPSAIRESTSWEFCCFCTWPVTSRGCRMKQCIYRQGFCRNDESCRERNPAGEQLIRASGDGIGARAIWNSYSDWGN